jgi:hypothetical protein
MLSQWHIAGEEFTTYGSTSVYVSIYLRARGTLLVAQLVEALRYKPEGHWFDSQCFHWIFSLT